MNKTHDHPFAWNHITKPDKRAIELFRARHPITNATADELLVDTIHSKLEIFKDYIYIVFHFPVYNQRLKTVFPSELDLIVHDNSVTTFSYKNLPFLEEFRESLKDESERKKAFSSTGNFLVALLRAHFKFVLRQLDHIKVNIDALEGSLFQGKAQKIVEELTFVHRDILDLARIVKSHDSVITRLKSLLRERYRVTSRIIDSVDADYLHIKNLIETHRETMGILYDTTASLLNIRTNEIMKMLTIFAVITFPLTLVATIFGMNTDYLPIVSELKEPWDFWVIFGFMVFGALSIYAFFKEKKWL